MNGAERDLPVLAVTPEGDGWRMEWPGAPAGVLLPSLEACAAAARSVYAVVRPPRAVAVSGAVRGTSSYPEGRRQRPAVDATEGEMRALWGNR